MKKQKEISLAQNKTKRKIKSKKTVVKRKENFRKSESETTIYDLS